MSRHPEPRRPAGFPPIATAHRRFAARRDHRIGAQRDREVCDDAEGVVDIQSLEHSVSGASVAKLLGRPAIQRRPMRASCSLELSDCRRQTTGEDGCILTQRLDHRSGELVALTDARTQRWLLFMERLLGNVDKLLELGHELDESTVLARWAGGPHAGASVLVLDSRKRGVGRLLAFNEGRAGRTPSHGRDNIGDRETRVCSSSSQRHVLEPWPEEDTRKRRHHRRDHPPGQPGGNRRNRCGDRR